jgi:hypothetical protein
LSIWQPRSFGIRFFDKNQDQDQGLRKVIDTSPAGLLTAEILFWYPLLTTKNQRNGSAIPVDFPILICSALSYLIVIEKASEGGENSAVRQTRFD